LAQISTKVQGNQFKCKEGSADTIRSANAQNCISNNRPSPKPQKNWGKKCYHRGIGRIKGKLSSSLIGDEVRTTQYRSGQKKSAYALSTKTPRFCQECQLIRILKICTLPELLLLTLIVLAQRKSHWKHYCQEDPETMI
jgi:hypothetical protein